MVVDLARLRAASGQAPRLARRDAGDRLGLTGKAAAREQRDAQLDELGELHGRLWAESQRSVLLVLQGVDTSGKDGVIRRVLSGLNPQGCSVTSFKVPTTLELERDYLWRVHNACPCPATGSGCVTSSWRRYCSTPSAGSIRSSRPPPRRSKA